MEGSALALHSLLAEGPDRTTAAQVAIQGLDKLELADDFSDLGWPQLAACKKCLLLHGANSFQAALKQLFSLRNDAHSLQHLAVEPLVDVVLNLGPVAQLLLLLG